MIKFDSLGVVTRNTDSRDANDFCSGTWWCAPTSGWSAV